MKLTVAKGSQIIDNVELLSVEDSANVDRASYFIGRSPECHVVINDPNISRNHVKIDLQEGRWFVENMATSGPLFLNGRPVNENKQEIKSDDIIQISHYHITVSLRESPQPTPPAPSTPEVQGEVQTEAQGEPQAELQVEPQSEVATEAQDEPQAEVQVEPQDKAQDEAQDEAEQASPESDENLQEAIEEDLFDEDSIAAEMDDAQEDQQGQENQEDQEGPEESDEDDDFLSASDDADAAQEDSSQSDEDDEYGLDEEMLTEVGAAPESGEMSETAEGDATTIEESFLEFELSIKGQYSNFDKFYISKDEIFVGRDPAKCQLVLNDPEVSQVHAVIRRMGSHCEIEDLQSTNGVIVSGSRVNQSKLTHGSKFLIGETAFVLRVKSEFIEEENESLLPVDAFEKVSVKEVVEKKVDVPSEDGPTDNVFIGETAGTDNQEVSLPEPIASQSLFKNPQKRKKLLIYLALGLGLWIVLDEEAPQQEKTTQKVAPQKNRSLVKNEGPSKNTEEPPVDKVDVNRSYENLSQDLKNFVRQEYELAKTEILDYGNYEKGLQHLDKMQEYVDEFEQSKSLAITAREEFEKLEEIEREKQRKQDAQEKRIRVEALLAKAEEGLKEEKTELVKAILGQILGLDPENIEAAQLQLQLDAFVKEQERKRLDQEQKKARRRHLVSEQKKGKSLYLKRKWYQAIVELEKFLSLEDNDEDLMKEATVMIKESSQNLNNITSPLLRRAQSLYEGQDYKTSYEAYKAVLKNNPSHAEALVKKEEIKEKIDKQARKIYRQAIVDESLNYLSEAKEKFHEVQQISPSDGPYYQKAKNKLKSYDE